MNKIEFTRFAELDYTGDEALNTLCTTSPLPATASARS